MSVSTKYNITVAQLREDIEFLTNNEYAPVFDALDAAIDAQIKRLVVTNMLSMGNTKGFAETKARYTIARYLRYMLNEDAAGRLSRETLVSMLKGNMDDLINGVV